MVSMKSFKKKITLSSFRKSKNKKNVESDPTKSEIIIEQPEQENEDSRIEGQENINTQNHLETRDDLGAEKSDDESTIDKSPVQEDIDECAEDDEEDTSLNHAVNNMLSPSKEESIKRRVTEAIEKVIADIHSDDLTDDDVSSLLASSLADETSKMDKKIDGDGDAREEAMHDFNDEFNGNTQSESQENFSVYDDSCSTGYGNSKLCNVFKCEKESSLQSRVSSNTKFCGFFNRKDTSNQQQPSYSAEDTSDMITEDYSDAKPTTPRVNFCGFFA